MNAAQLTASLGQLQMLYDDVVTASQDSLEVHGYTDEAIGHFSATGPVPGRMFGGAR